MKKYVGVILAIAALTISTVGQAFASSPGFSLTSSCEVVYKFCGPAHITVQSLNGFSGTVNLSTSLVGSNCTRCTFSSSMSPNNVTLTSGGSATSTLKTTDTCGQTPNCTWTVTITGTSGTISNSTSVDVCVGNDCRL